MIRALFRRLRAWVFERLGGDAPDRLRASLLASLEVAPDWHYPREDAPWVEGGWIRNHLWQVVGLKAATWQWYSTLYQLEREGVIVSSETKVVWTAREEG